MKHPKLRKELFLALIFSLAYLLLLTFSYHLDKMLPGISIGFLRVLLLVILSLLLASQIYKIIRRRRKSKGRIKLRAIFYLPSCILLFTILYGFSPVKLNSELLEAPVRLHGCYEQGANKASITFRKNGSFEMKWKTDADFADWYTGTYLQKKDTLLLTYFDKNPDKFGSIILNNGEMLISLDEPHRAESYIQFSLFGCNTKN